MPDLKTSRTSLHQFKQRARRSPAIAKHTTRKTKRAKQSGTKPNAFGKTNGKQKQRHSTRSAGLQNGKPNPPRYTSNSQNRKQRHCSNYAPKSSASDTGLPEQESQTSTRAARADGMLKQCDTSSRNVRGTAPYDSVLTE